MPQLPSQSQQPLKVRNMATQSQNQTQLLEKFRKLRQWQQQQQESMFRQQQQATEVLKSEQSKLQSILAAQKRLQEQQSTSSLTVQSLSSQVDAEGTTPLTMQNQQQQFARMPTSINTMTSAAGDGNTNNGFVGQKSNDPLRAIPTSSMLPVSVDGLPAVSQGELFSRMPEMQKGLVRSQQQSEVPQVATVEENRFEGSLASFNATVYPMMWNSSNYRLPLGTIPVSTGAHPIPLQGQHVFGSTSPHSPMSHLGMKSKEIIEVAHGFQSPDSDEELERLMKYNSKAEMQTHLAMGEKKDDEANSTPVMMPQQLQFERLWSQNPSLQLLASVESHTDEQSEADAMSGVYPLYDSDSELGVNEVDDEGHVGEEDDDDSDAEEEFEESSYRDRTVIDLAALPDEPEGKVLLLLLLLIIIACFDFMIVQTPLNVVSIQLLHSLIIL